MKTLFSGLLLAGLIFGVPQVGRAQKPLPVVPGDTLPVRNEVLYEADILKLRPSITPKSPYVAALERYGDYPVSFYTGLPVIEIPLFEFSVGTRTVPIKLTYHAAGHRVNDQASWVGLGWSLQTGGMVSRDVQGIPDERFGVTLGPLLARLITPPSYNMFCPQDSELTLLRRLANKDDDSQRDLFSFRTPSGSGSFVLTPTAPGYVLRAPEPTRISYTLQNGGTDIGSFTLADPDGFSYRFTDSESATFSEGPVRYNSAWLLNEIVSPTTNDRAVYSYTSVVNSSLEYIDVQPIRDDVYLRSGSSMIIGAEPLPTRKNVSRLVSGQQPTDIWFPGGRIRFVTENRGPALDETAGNRLKTIEIYAYDVLAGTYQLIKQIGLSYVQKARATGPYSTLFLDKVSLLNNVGELVGQYAMTYNALPLPAASSYAQDYWGFYNGRTDNQTLIPPTPITIRNGGLDAYTIVVGGGNREPDATAMKAWALQSINYPTGGSSQFDFEPNQYLRNGALQVAGGLRIRQMRHYSAAAQLANTKTYRYGTGETGAGKLRLFNDDNSLRPPYNRNDILVENHDALSPSLRFSYRVRTFTSSADYPLSGADGSPVTYASVTEYGDDGSGTNGRTVYTFRDNADDVVLRFLSTGILLNSYDWNRGQLLSEQTFSASGQPLTRTEHEYQTVTEGDAGDLTGMLAAQSVQQTGLTIYNDGCFLVADRFIPYFPTYRYHYGLVRRVRSRAYRYDPADPGRYTQQTTETDYAPNFYLPRETRTFAEGGIVLGTRMSYPQDFGPAIPVSAGPELQGIRAMQNRNVYRPVETVGYRQETTTAPKSYKTGQLTTYRPLTLNGMPAALLYQLYQAETVYGATTYQSSADRYRAAGGTGSALTLDPLWAAPRLTMSSYDAYGNLTAYRVADGAATRFTYNTHTPTGGVIFPTLASQIQNDGQANAQTTTYSYQLPLLGPSGVTNPRGLTTRYVYDGYGRLQTVKDNDGNVLKHYTYRYATQP